MSKPPVKPLKPGLRIQLEPMKRFPDSCLLIPLHCYTDTAIKHGRVRLIGKAPLAYDWTKRNYRTKDTLKAAADANRNVGFRMTAKQLVLDIDPRNGGDDGYAALKRDLKLDDSEWPKAITGSGGGHFFLSKPGNVLTMVTLEAYPGVEFKTLGTQVVVAGSIHPESGKHYRWDDDHPSIADGLPDAPDNLMRLIRRPPRPESAGGGNYTPHQLTKALENLDATDFKDQDKWLRFMMACHHATAGDARTEFIDWSISDPDYANDADYIGRRWDSLHKEKEGAITSATLNMYLRQAGAADAQAAPTISDDEFDDGLGDDDYADTTSSDADEDDWLGAKAKPPAPALPDEVDPFATADDLKDGVPPENELSILDTTLLEKLNERFYCCPEGGKLRIISKEFDPVMKRPTWRRMMPHDFMILYGNQQILRDTSMLGKNASPVIPLGKGWLEWIKRRNVEGITFDPINDHPGWLNLWTGWAYQPCQGNEGSWDILKAMILECLCDNNREIYDYIINWTAFMFQHPDQQAEVAVVFKGGMGIGKGTLANVIQKVVGNHAMAAASAELITGRFNSHLQDLIFLFADEAIKPYDKQAESRLRAFITEKRLSYEGKGRDAIMGNNYLHIIMATNDSWAVPAGLDERRFLVTNCNAAWQGDFKKWKALHAELTRDNDLGYRRFLFDMLTHELPEEWHPRLVPMTEGLQDEKIRSMTPVPQYLFDCVWQRAFPFETFGQRGVKHDSDWERAPVRMFLEDFRNGFTNYCRGSNINPGSSGRNNTMFLLREISKLFPIARTNLRTPVGERMDIQTGSDGRAPCIEFPSLTNCRFSFDKHLKSPVAWDGEKPITF